VISFSEIVHRSLWSGEKGCRTRFS